LFDFYKDLLGTPLSSSDIINFPALIGLTLIHLTQAAPLIRLFALGDIRMTLFYMNDNSSSRPDGFGSAFFKKNWELVKGCVPDSLNNFHSLSADLHPINKSYIVFVSFISGRSIAEC
jgi:hypothetical protein